MKHVPFFLLLAALAFVQCGYKYDILIDKSLETGKLPAAVFAVFPLPELAYRPPSSCLYNPNASAGLKVQHGWDRRIQNELTKEYPGARWRFLSPEEPFFQKENRDVDYICGLAAKKDPPSMSSSGSDDLIVYKKMIRVPDLEPILKEVADTLGADYAVLFIHPSIQGEMHTSYNAPMMDSRGRMYGGGSSSYVTFTTDVVIQVWDCRTGTLLFCTGGWDKAAGYCLFISPEDQSIQTATEGMIRRLHLIIGQVLQWDGRGALARRE